MAEHKAPSEVSIVPRGEERSGFALWVQKNGLMLFVGLLLIGGVIILRTQMSASSIASEKADWSQLTASLQSVNPSLESLQTASPEGLAKSSETLASSAVAGAWARYAYATSLGLQGDYAEADTELARLQTDFPEHALNITRYFWGPDDRRTLPEQMRRIYSDQAKWRAEHAGTFDNIAPPADAPRLTIQTSAGDIVVALYPNLAPLHVQNFLELADSDYYVGTKFHRVMPNFMIQGGDPNSKNEDNSTWGEGGPEHTITHEENDLKHFRGYLSAAKKGTDIEESGSQFFITTGSPHHLDGKHTVYGVVLSGMDVVTTIEQGETDLGGGAMPRDPVEILKVSRN